MLSGINKDFQDRPIHKIGDHEILHQYITSVLDNKTLIAY